MLDSQSWTSNLGGQASKQRNPVVIITDESGMLALSIRQPYAEMILRGEKTVEYRSRPTKIIGERFYIYAARKWAENPINGDLSLTLALSQGERESMPTGVIVGSAVVAKCVQHNGLYEWHLVDVKRYKRPRKLPPGTQPQPVWFVPF